MESRTHVVGMSSSLLTLLALKVEDFINSEVYKLIDIKYSTIVRKDGTTEYSALIVYK